MSRMQLFITYAIAIFMVVWGSDLLAALKFNSKITVGDVFSLFIFSQLIYSTATILLTGVVFRRYFVRKNYAALVAGAVGLILFFILLRYSLEEVLFPILFDVKNYRVGTTFLYYTLDNIYYAIIYIILGFLIFLLDNQFRIQKQQAELIQQRKTAELQFLRSQINPHFLFNTLNNIYSLVYEKSDKAPAATLQLSELIRYTLYEKNETVPLSKEWKYIQSFIELQQLRLDKPLAMEIDVNGLTENIEIAPYLLISFVENAFKHGDVTNPESPLTICLSEKNKNIQFEIQNKIGNQQKDNTGGVGLENVRRRLELVYPGKHELIAKTENDVYSVKLSILTT